MSSNLLFPIAIVWLFLDLFILHKTTILKFLCQEGKRKPLICMYIDFSVSSMSKIASAFRPPAYYCTWLFKLQLKEPQDLHQHNEHHNSTVLGKAIIISHHFNPFLLLICTSLFKKFNHLWKSDWKHDFTQEFSETTRSSMLAERHVAKHRKGTNTISDMSPMYTQFELEKFSFRCHIDKSHLRDDFHV